MTGRSPNGSGSRPSDRAADGVSPVPASIPSAAWLPIEDAPRDGTPIFGRTFDGFTLVAHYERDGYLDEDEQPIGSWVAEYEDEHPDDWTDGACWASNENGDPSDPLVAFINLAGLAWSVAERCKYRPGTDNYARVYQGALLGAKSALRSIASAIEARRAETGTGSVHESAVAAKRTDAQPSSPSGSSPHISEDLL